MDELKVALENFRASQNAVIAASQALQEACLRAGAALADMAAELAEGIPDE